MNVALSWSVLNFRVRCVRKPYEKTSCLMKSENPMSLGAKSIGTCTWFSGRVVPRDFKYTKKNVAPFLWLFLCRKNEPLLTLQRQLIWNGHSPWPVNTKITKSKKHQDVTVYFSYMYIGDIIEMELRQKCIVLHIWRVWLDFHFFIIIYIFPLNSVTSSVIVCYIGENMEIELRHKCYFLHIWHMCESGGLQIMPCPYVLGFWRYCGVYYI